jgi:hypothetical protein
LAFPRWSAAEQYHRKYKRPVTLVIDGVQDGVGSHAASFFLVTGCSCTGESDIENDEDAVDFFVRRELDKARAVKSVRDVAGGRFVLLLKGNAMMDVAAIRKFTDNQIRTVLKRLGLA